MRYSVIDSQENDIIQTDDISIAYKIADILRLENYDKIINVWDNEDCEMI